VDASLASAYFQGYFVTWQKNKPRKGIVAQRLHAAQAIEEMPAQTVEHSVYSRLTEWGARLEAL
jgi:hypothetical protein